MDAIGCERADIAGLLIRKLAVHGPLISLSIAALT
jgi:hypothetical protein